MREMGEGGREREGGERAVARRSINPLAVIATRSRYTHEIKFRVSSTRQPPSRTLSPASRLLAFRDGSLIMPQPVKSRTRIFVATLSLKSTDIDCNAKYSQILDDSFFRTRHERTVLRRDINVGFVRSFARFR